ncbi:MAG TPA: hypothetical protein VHB73_05865, partial [Alphaproteobacteria bacterium]|nr:hypothetical protein [Alphaproteobacteria bacterium]
MTMRRLIAALAVVFFLALQVSAHADAVISSQCSLDRTVADGNQTFTICPVEGENDALRVKDNFDGARLNATVPGAGTQTKTPIFVHGICKYVDAVSTTDALFIPFKTLNEWQCFLGIPNSSCPDASRLPTGVRTAECCTPRNLSSFVDVTGTGHLADGRTPADVPLPSETCSTGWVFQGLVDPSNTDRLIATPNSDGTFTQTAGFTDSLDYPVKNNLLSIQRDDIGAILPDNATHTLNTPYVAKFHCAGEVDLSTSTSPVTLSTTRIDVTTVTQSQSLISGATTGSGVLGRGTKAAPTTGKIKNVTKFMGFTLVCSGAEWKHNTPICSGVTTNIREEACPDGGEGSISIAQIQQCDGTTTEQEITNTCHTLCPAKDIHIEDRPCPEGDDGKLTVEVTKLCFGRQPVGEGDAPSTAGSCNCTTIEKVTGNTCHPSCPPTTDLGDKEQACPDGTPGHIIINTKRVCVSQGEQCVCHDEETQKENTCRECPPVTDKGNKETLCPDGKAGHIVTNTKSICTVQNNACVCHDEETKVEDTCNACVPELDKVEERECPTGQVGKIVVLKQRLCHQSCECGGAQCLCEDKEKTLINTCVTCPPDTDLGTTTALCPPGQTGTITTSTHRLCTSQNGQCVCRDQQNVTQDCKLTCTPTTNVVTGQCPPGFTGSI